MNLETLLIDLPPGGSLAVTAHDGTLYQVRRDGQGNLHLYDGARLVLSGPGRYAGQIEAIERYLDGLIEVEEYPYQHEPEPPGLDRCAYRDRPCIPGWCCCEPPTDDAWELDDD